jgi:hypothetical protein
MIARSIVRPGARQLAGLILLAALFSLLNGVQARAENLGPGGGSRVIAGDEAVGPYRLFITSSPDPAQPGKVTFVVRITDPKTGETVKTADVRVSLALPESNVTLDAPATHEDAGNPVDYAAHVQIDQPGQYEGIIRVTAAAGPAEVKFIQRVLTPRTTSTLLVLALPFAAALAILGGFWYLRAKSHTAPRQ